MQSRIGRCILHSSLAAATLVGAALSAPLPVLANERHFTYTYESAVPPPGGRELELWSTFRNDRTGYYSRLDQRAEFEVGISDRLLSQLARRRGGRPHHRRAHFELPV
jgi:hypothetical protein